MANMSRCSLWLPGQCTKPLSLRPPRPGKKARKPNSSISEPSDLGWGGTWGQIKGPRSQDFGIGGGYARSEGKRLERRSQIAGTGPG